MSVAARRVRMAKKGATFSPADVAGLVGWWKADALGLADNDPVSSWADSSGSGNTMSQATGTAQPAYKATGPNSKPYVDFDATDDLLATAAPVSTLTNNFTMVMVSRKPDTGSSQGHAPFYNGTGASNGYGPSGATGSTANRVGWLRGGIAWHTSAVTRDSNWHILVLRRTAGTGLAYRDRGSGVASTASAPNTPTGSTRLGFHDTGGDKNADIAESLFYAAALSDANLNLLGAHLGAKYGITWTNV